jgi:arsenate reductase
LLTIYGIPNCDSCRKTRKWLDTNGIEYEFHDLRQDGVDETMLERWAGAVGWKALLNTRSTTWRGLPDADKQAVDESRAIRLMATHPTLVKRPVAEQGSKVTVGFSPQSFSQFDR